MFRTVPLCVLLLFTSATVSAADLPKPMYEVDRAKLIEAWQKRYVAEKARLTLDAKQDTAARKELAAITKEPALATGGVGGFQKTADTSATGSVGPLIQASVTVVDITSDGVVVENVYTVNRILATSGFGIPTAKETVVGRYLIASELKTKKGAKIKLPGAWEVAGSIDYGGKKIPVLYHFEIKPGEVPK